MGFTQKNSRALLDNDRNNHNYKNDYTGKKKKADRNPESLLTLEDRDYKNEARRGDYIPYQKKLQNQPVRVSAYGK